VDLDTPALDQVATEKRRDTVDERCREGVDVSAGDPMADALSRIADALAKLADVQEKRYDKDYPKERPRLPAVIERPSDEKKEQYSDRADPEWVEETERTATRFRERFDSAKDGTAT
jgi:hypothetical protein